MATHRSAKSTKGWGRAAPRKGPERRKLYARCGRAAFLLPNTKKPGYSEYPIVARGSGCQVDCRGARAAKARALQQISRGGIPKSEVKRLRKVAGRAETIARRSACEWTR